MKRWLLVFMIAIAATGASRISRTSVAAMEKSFDARLEREVLDGDQFLLLGMTRGVYVEGFGIVYSAEVDLAPVPGINPFHPEMTKQDWGRVRQKKLARLSPLRTAMKQMLLDTASSIDGLGPEEVVALGVTVTRRPQEDSTGIPSQIVMRAAKKALLEHRTQLDTVIKVQEF